MNETSSENEYSEENCGKFEESDELIQNYKKVQSTTYVSTSEDEAREISGKRKTIDQTGNDVYFLKNGKRRHVRNGQKEVFIKWHNFPCSESTWEPEKNIFPNGITKNYFKDVINKTGNNQK